MRYPPHTHKKLGWARFFILNTVDLGWMGRMALLAVLAVVAAVALQVSYRGREKHHCKVPHRQNVYRGKEKLKEKTLKYVTECIDRFIHTRNDC